MIRLCLLASCGWSFPVEYIDYRYDAKLGSPDDSTDESDSEDDTIHKSDADSEADMEKSDADSEADEDEMDVEIDDDDNQDYTRAILDTVARLAVRSKVRNSLLFVDTSDFTSH